MSRPKKDFPAYRLHAPTGRAVVTLTDAVSGDRREVPLGEHGTRESKRLYETTVARWLAEGRRLPDDHPEGDGLSNNELVLAYFKANSCRWERRGKKQSSEEQNSKAAAKFLRRLYGSEAARLMSPKRLKAVRKAMVLHGWTRKQVNRQVNRLRRVYKWGVSEELIPGEVLHALRAVDPLRPGEDGVKDRPRVKPVEEELVRRCLPYMQRPVAAMVELLLWTGARSGEIVLMRPADIDTSGDVWVFTPRYHKAEKHGRERRVLIGPEGRKVLEPYLEGCAPDEHVFSPRKAEAVRLAERAAARKTPRWKSHMDRNRAKRVGDRRKRRPGPRYDVVAFRRAVAYGIEKADREARKARDKGLIEAGKLPEDFQTPPKVKKAERLVASWHPHQLRHAAATRLRKQFGIEMARVVLGHSNIEVSELYAEIDLDAAKAAMARSG